MNEKRNNQDDTDINDSEPPTSIEKATSNESESTKEEEDVVASDENIDVDMNSVNKEVVAPKEEVDEINSDQLINANKKIHENDGQEVK